MYKGKEIIGIIPARGGSKGIPRKNLLNLNGYPLIAWTILRALKSKYIDRLILSSEDSEIIRIAKKYGCEVPFIRPYKFATDEASSVDVVMHALEELRFIGDNKYFILLQPTSPLRTIETIDKTIEFTINNDYPYVMSVSELDKSPYHMYWQSEDNLLKPIIKMSTDFSRRQDLPKALFSNGVIYMMNTSYFVKYKNFKTKNMYYIKTSITESLDIDTQEDFDDVNRIIENSNIQPI